MANKCELSDRAKNKYGTFLMANIYEIKKKLFINCDSIFDCLSLPSIRDGSYID